MKSRNSLKNTGYFSAGTPITPVNANFGSANTSAATVKFVNKD
ncbi:hypothetical protein ABES25_23760 [Bacillus gobiensis]